MSGNYEPLFAHFRITANLIVCFKSRKKMKFSSEIFNENEYEIFFYKQNMSEPKKKKSMENLN